MASSIERMMQEINTLSAEERLRLAGRILETVLPSITAQSKHPAEANHEPPYRKLRGKYREMLRPGDEFARLKQEEIRLENRSI